MLKVPSRYVLLTQCTLICTMYTACLLRIQDVLVQCTVEGRSFPSEIDGRRTAVFGAFGFTYLGFAQWGIYVTGFRRIFDPKVMDKVRGEEEKT